MATLHAGTPINVYKFKVKPAARLEGLRTIRATNYTDALNMIYFPTDGTPQLDGSTLIGLLNNGIWRGDLTNPGIYDLKEITS